MRARSGWILCWFFLFAPIPRASASEIGDYLESRGMSASSAYGSPGGVRADTLHEGGGYASDWGMFGEPPEPTEPFWAPLRPHLKWLPPLPWPDFRHSDPDDPVRHIGLGNPLVGTSWRNRPFHIGWLFGGLHGDTLINGQLRQNEDVFGGYRVGWDFDHFWGVDARAAFAHLDLASPQGPLNRTSRDWFFDVNLSHYPWGDSQWRPYLAVGVGTSRFDYLDHNRRRIKDRNITMPFGVGLKYYWKKWLALRADVTNNLVFPSDGTGVMHNYSLTAGVEVRIGGAKRKYSSW